MYELAFVLEQTLGHVAHARNIAHAIERRQDSIHATVVPIEYRNPSRFVGSVPGLRTWSFQASRQARRALIDRLREGRLDAVFIHTQVAALLAQDVMRRVPVVISLDATPVNYDSEGSGYGHRRGLPMLESLKLRVNRSVFERAAALVTWCRWAADSLVHDYGIPASRITVVHPGVDVRLFEPVDRRGHSGPVRILMVGGDFTRKGGPDLLAAVKRLGPAVEVDVVTGSDVEPPPDVVCRLHRGLAPHAREIVELYRAADIFVLPSRADCFPQAVAEGMASGLPIVATDVGAIKEMIVHGENGYVVPARNVSALATALDALVASPSERRRMGANSRTTALREHDADANNRRIIDIMLEVSAAHAARRSVAAAST